MCNVQLKGTENPAIVVEREQRQQATVVGTDKIAANNMGFIILIVIASVLITVPTPHNVPTISLQARHNAYRTGTIASHHETPMIPGFVAMPTVAMPVPKIDITRSMMVSNSLDYGLFYYLLVASCYILTCEFSVLNLCIKFPSIGMVYLCVRVCVILYCVVPVSPCGMPFQKFQFHQQTFSGRCVPL